MPKFPHNVPGLQFEKLLARSGSSSVYAAADSRHDRQVAVKMLDSRSTRGTTSTSKGTFERELQAMGRLSDHPYVVDLYDSGITDTGVPYLVMPLIATGTIAERIDRQEQFEIDEILEIGVKLASAVETAHRRAILHCDIKPSNIFLGPYSSPLLGDLGIASIADTAGQPSDSSALTILYAAPEVIGDVAHSTRSDVYSLGATLFAMVELAPPFPGRTSRELVAQISGATEPPKLRRAVPPELATIVAQMMAIDAADRPAATRVIEALQAIQRQRSGTQTPATIGATAVRETRALDVAAETDLTVDHLQLAALTADRRSRGWVMATIGGALLVAIAGGGIAFGLMADRSDPTGVTTSDVGAGVSDVETVVQVAEASGVREELVVSCDEWWVPLSSELVEARTVTVAADVEVRRAPDADAACERGVLLRSGTPVEIHAERPGWSYTFNPASNDWGWVTAETFDETIDCNSWSIPVAGEEVEATAMVVLTDYSLRRAPGHDPVCERGIIIAAGAAVEVHGIRGDWRYAFDRAAGQWGWMHQSAFPAEVDCTSWYTPLDSELVTIYRSTTTVETIVRRAPGHDVACERGVRLEPGTTVEIHAEHLDWNYTYNLDADDWGWVHDSIFAEP